MHVRDYLFKDLQGCSSHACIIKPPSGMGTNGICYCMTNMDKYSLALVGRRIGVIAGHQVIGSDKAPVGVIKSTQATPQRE